MEETRYIGRANPTKRLTSLEGSGARAIGGSARLEYAGATLTVTPLFGLGHEGEYERAVLGPLLEALGEDHTVAALLIRLGGYAVGAFEGERLVASKVGSRFVKVATAPAAPRPTARRRREGQERELVEAAAEAASLTPWQGKVERAALGGDRAATRRVPPAPTLPGCSRSCSNGSLPCPSCRRILDEPPTSPRRRQGSRAAPAQGHAASSGSNSGAPQPKTRPAIAYGPAGGAALRVRPARPGASRAAAART